MKNQVKHIYLKGSGLGSAFLRSAGRLCYDQSPLFWVCTRSENELFTPCHFSTGITIYVKAKLKSCCSLLIICLTLSSGCAQEATSKSEKDLDAQISIISEKLQSPIIDSTQLYSDMHSTLKLAQVGSFKKQVASSYRNLAIWHNKSASIDSVELYLNKAVAVYQKSNFPLLEAETYLIQEDVYKQRGEYGKAMTEDFKALKLFEQQEDLNGIAKSYTRLCDLLYYQEKFAEGVDYCQKAIDIQKQLNSPEDLSVSYRYKSDNLLILERYDEALVAINSAIEVLKNAGSNAIDIAPNYNTRGNIYKYLNRYDDAIIEYKRCYQIAKDANAERGLIPALANIGHVYRLQGKNKEALPYTLEAIEMMKLSGNVQNLAENYNHASGSYEALEQYKKALDYERLYSDARIGEHKQIIAQLESELQIKYESAKKDETIEELDATINRQRKIQLLSIGIALLLGVILFGMYFIIKNIRKKRKTLTLLNAEFAKNQKALEGANNKLKLSIDELKSTQEQLIQSEKMASLGELTAGIAHEIQNPLNFVNNFSELSSELLDEMNEEIAKGDLDEAKTIANEIRQNLIKIYHHGQRADNIVKGMLQHSRKDEATKEPTDINKLAEEYLRLAYHGLRAKDKSFNAKLETDFDENIGLLNVIPQDMGRVILNLITNALYAVNEKKNAAKNDEFKPTVSVSTKWVGASESSTLVPLAIWRDEHVKITVKDNGNGIPKHVLKKIFQPFFTTKPTGQGTGLGLSMSYDIIKAHGGELKVETVEGKYCTFNIIIPINQI